MSVKDEFYHRHIIQHNLFAPVFESLRTNPVGDNLLSSAIVEMCDYIHSQNIKSLIEHIVTVHVAPTFSREKSLEDLSSPYVNTLTILRQAYEENLRAEHSFANPSQSDGNGITAMQEESRYFVNLPVTRTESAPMSEKAREDQVNSVCPIESHCCCWMQISPSVCENG